jgi:hypothetical protein
MPRRIVTHRLRLGKGCHSRESGNLLKDWIPGQARNDKLRKTHIVTYSSIVFFLPIIFLSAFFTTVFSQTSSVLEVGMFSREKAGEGIPTDWNPLTFKKIERLTDYMLVKDGDNVVVKAVANASASGLVRKIRINPDEYPIVQWRWKVGNILKKADVHKKEGDDYPARIYITFEYDPSKVSFFEKMKYETIRLFYGQYPPLAAINYIWEAHAPVETIVPNPYTNRAMMIVLESGEEKINQWVCEERNILEDYKKAFGETSPMISGVAIMTDTDNTGESATAYYGDILFKKAVGGCP